MSTNQKILSAAIIGALWLAAIVVIHFFPDVKEYVTAFILMLASTLSALGIHSASSKPPVLPAAPGNKEGGRSMLSFLAFLIFAGLMALTMMVLSGCAGPTNAFVSGLMTQEASNVRGTDDNLGKMTVWSFCHMPLEWHQRHPEYQKARDTLCGPMASDPNAIDVQQLNALVTVLRAAGVTLQAAPAK